MIRGLMVMVLAAALGALMASAAQAHTTATFTAKGANVGETITLTVLPDGTVKTAHQVLEIRKADGTGVLGLTCDKVSGDGHVIGPVSTDATFSTPQFEGNCNFAGQNVKIENTGCDFTYTHEAPQLHIQSKPGAVAPNRCLPGEKPIHFTNTNLNCKIEWGEQTVSGIKYHNLADGTLTVEATNLALSYTATGAGCPYGSTTNGLLTTGNAIVTGEKINGGPKVELTYHPTVP